VYKRIVVKIGSSTITRGSGPPNAEYISQLASQIMRQKQLGRQIVLVSSGAIAAGMDRLQLTEKPRNLSHKQAAAAIGQGLLMEAYEQAFSWLSIPVAQILLTREDIQDRQRYVRASGTIDAILHYGAIPIVNENDTIAVDEIKFGDNDTLAALVATLTDADALLILSDVDGLYDENPNDNPKAKLIPVVAKIDRAIERLAGGVGSKIGSGGMKTKIAAARICASSGIATIIASGNRENVIEEALEAKTGTVFLPKKEHALRSRKRWIAFGGQPKGDILVNDGARSQIIKGGKSLLPAGIVSVRGDFVSSDLVDIMGSDGLVFAQGIVNYDSASLIKIKGKRSGEILKILGEKNSDEAIHRDNLALKFDSVK